MRMRLISNLRGNIINKKMERTLVDKILDLSGPMKGESMKRLGHIGSLVYVSGLLFAAFVLLISIEASALDKSTKEKTNPRVTVGAYYFDGWAGQSRGLAQDPELAKLNPPTHLTRLLLGEYAEREPVWGWRDDTLEIVERQIGLAAENGIAFFSFCWYFHRDPKTIENNPLHTGLQLYLKAKNNHRLKFCLLVANHQGFEIKTTADWKQATELWMPYLTHKQYLRVDGRPLVIIFSPQGGDKAGFEYLQESARKAGLPGVAIAACNAGDFKMGYTHRTHYNIIPGYASGPEKHKYAELVAAHQKQWHGTSQQPYIPEITAGWDKRPWEGRDGLNQAKGWYYPDRTPEQFAAFLESAIRWMDKHPEQTTSERIVLVYAWNEFGEGGYIAPTRGDPDGKYLKALKSVVMPKVRGLDGGRLFQRVR
jgi:hypothetical protein